MPASRHACPIQGCTVTFSRRHDIKRHLELHNEGAQNRWACPIDGCERTMSQKSNMVNHIRNIHASESSPTLTRTRTRCSTPASKSVKIPLGLARAVEADCVNSVSSIQACMGAFQISDSHDMGIVPCKVEEPGHLSTSTPTTPDSVPSLSPSNSVSGSMSPPSCEEYIPCPAFGYDFPTASPSTPSEYFDYNDLVSQSISVTCLNFNFTCPEAFSTPPFDMNIACPDLLPTIPVQEDVYCPQYWNASSSTFIPAYGLVNPLIDSQPELQNITGFDPSCSYIPANEPRYGAQMFEESPEYQPAVIGVPPVYLNSHDDLFVPSINAIDYSDLDLSYFDPSWNISAPLDNFDAALNYC
ncbi:hypothetical protein BJ912DRAFT_968294 [Pholiota molesta]|nr:hypothetical protein BJ912DRAFT_968294 [Pholiota molesta]